MLFNSRPYEVFYQRRIIAAAQMMRQ